jgi:hypothetical protein
MLLRNILRTMTKQCWLFRRETGKTGLFIVKNRSSETIRTTLLTLKEGVRIISDDKTNAEFNSWLAGLIDGDGTLEIGTQTKSGHCYTVGQGFALQTPNRRYSRRGFAPQPPYSLLRNSLLSCRRQDSRRGPSPLLWRQRIWIVYIL